MKGYYFITDAGLSRAGNLSDVTDAVAARAAAVQYREKQASTRNMLEEAWELRKICHRGGVLFLVNDRVDLALAIEADDVHLGQEDLPYAAARRLLGENKIIGVTVHTVPEALAAADLGADYLGVSPIFPTATKADSGAPGGLWIIREIRQQVALPLIAIGGVTLENAGEVIRAGADALCAISAVVTQNDVGAEIEKFQALFRQKY